MDWDTMTPRPYDLTKKADVQRLLEELAGYMNPTMPWRQKFLQDGTDTTGRKYAMQALDNINIMNQFGKEKRFKIENLE